MNTRRTKFNLISVVLSLLSSVGIALAQSGGGCYAGQVIAPPQPNGLGQPVPGAIVRVCASSATGTPCSPLTPGGLFSDPGLLNPISNPFTADQNGNYNFCSSTGNYLVQISPPGSTYSFQISVGISPSGSFTFSGNNTFSAVNTFSANNIFSAPQTFTEGACSGAVAGSDILCADSTLHAFKVSLNNGAFIPIPQLAGDLGGTAASPTVARIQGTAVAGTTGSGLVVLATSPAIGSPTITGNINASSGTVFCWNSDSGITRQAAAQFNLGTCTPGDQSGSLNLTTLTVSKVTTVGNLTVTALGRDCRKDGLVGDGSVDDSAALNNCVTNALVANQSIIQLPCAQIKLTSSGWNLTNLLLGQGGLTIQGCGAGNHLGASPGYQSGTTELLCNTGSGKFCMERVGSSNVNLRDFSMSSVGASTPSIGLLLDGRDNAAGGGNGPFCFSEFNTIRNVQMFTAHNGSANGGSGLLGIYNIGAEDYSMDNIRVVADQPLWFSTINDLSIASQYQTLSTGCPGSMTVVSIRDSTVQPTNANSSGIRANNTDNFKIENLGYIVGGLVAFPVVWGGNNSNWRVTGQIEQAVAPAAFGIILSGIIDHMDIDIATSSGTGAASGYITINASNCCTMSNSSLKVTVLNGTAQPLVTDSNWIIRGSTLDLGTTANPVNLTAITLVGDVIRANGFADADIAMPVGALGVALFDNTGFSVWNGVGQGKIPDYARVTTDFTTANNTNLQTITGLTFNLPAIALNYSFHCGLGYSQATGNAGVTFGVQAATVNPTNIFATDTTQISIGPPSTYVSAVLPTLTTTTATGIVTGTPGATATNYTAQIDGTIENPTAANILNFNVGTATGADAVTVKRGSYCTLFPY